MFKSVFSIGFMIILVAFVGVGCMPQSAKIPAKEIETTYAEVEEPALKDAVVVQGEGVSAMATVANNDSQVSGVKITVDVTPLPDELLDEQPVGQTEPNAGELDGNVSDEDREFVLPGDWVDYVDTFHNFKLGLPNDYVVQFQDEMLLAQFEPKPTASIFIMNPDMAKGELAGIEPPDLSIRIFKDASINSVDALENWLRTVGLFTDGESGVESYQNGSVNGLKICFSALLAPGCSVFVVNNGFIYQLTPLGSEGEAIMDSFVPHS